MTETTNEQMLEKNKPTTKGDYANMIIDQFCETMHLDRSKMTEKDWGHYISYSSKLGVCLDYFHLLSAEDSERIKNRGGIYDIDLTTFKVISVREHMASLPDDELPDKQVFRLSAENTDFQSILNVFKQYRFDKYFIDVDIRLEIDNVNHKIKITDR